MLTKIQELWLKRRIARARTVNKSLSAALGLVNRFFQVRRSRRARKLKDLRYHSTKREKETASNLSRRDRLKLLALWLITCDVRYYRKGLA